MVAGFRLNESLRGGRGMRLYTGSGWKKKALTRRLDKARWTDVC